MADGSEFTHKEPCPSCNSKDNLARYTDGHAFCFGCAYYEAGNGEASTAPSRQHASKSDKPLIQGEAAALEKRSLHKASCEKWRYWSAYDDAGKPCQVANYCDDAGRIIAQKVRYPDKKFSWLGSPKEVGLYGQWLWKEGGRQVIVTEGEIDALSVSQAQNHKWPVVSVPNGAQGASRSFRKSIDFLNKFEKVVILFDNDEHGRNAAEECAALLRPGQAYIASLPLKDANDMLQKGRTAELITATYEARPFRPDGIVTGLSLVSKALKAPEVGLSWPFPEMTKATFGRRYGEVISIGAGTGVGKTDFLTQCIEHDLFTLKQRVGVLFLEQQPEETLRRIIGKHEGKMFHLPNGSWTQQELESAFERAAPIIENLHLFDHFGAADWETVESRMRYLIVGCGCKLIYLDHLTALAAAEDDERKALEVIMAKLAGLAQETGAILHVVSHLATPEGKPHEEGGRVMIRQFKGSRAIGFWSHTMIGLERDQQAEDLMQRTRTIARWLKARNSGATGKTFPLMYDETTGLLSEAGSDVFADAEF